MSLTSYQAAPPCNKGRRNVRLPELPVNRLFEPFGALGGVHGDMHFNLEKFLP